MKSPDAKYTPDGGWLVDDENSAIGCAVQALHQTAMIPHAYSGKAPEELIAMMQRTANGALTAIRAYHATSAPKRAPLRELVELLNRGAAAIETPGDLTPEALSHVAEDLAAMSLTLDPDQNEDLS